MEKGIIDNIIIKFREIFFEREISVNTYIDLINSFKEFKKEGLSIKDCLHGFVLFQKKYGADFNDNQDEIAYDIFHYLSELSRYKTVWDIGGDTFEREVLKWKSLGDSSNWNELYD